MNPALIANQYKDMFTFSPAFKLKAETFLMVFVSTFLASVGSQLQSLSLSTLSWSVVGSLTTSAIGIACQAVYNSFVSSSLGNQLKGLTAVTLQRIKGQQ